MDGDGEGLGEAFLGGVFFYRMAVSMGLLKGFVHFLQGLRLPFLLIIYAAFYPLNRISNHAE